MDASDPRRARILATARDVFAREGFRRAEVKTIASALSIGSGAAASTGASGAGSSCITKTCGLQRHEIRK